MTIICHLPFISRIQRLYMTEESAKQMTWHKNGKRYNPNKMVHAFDGEAWKHLNAIHRKKAEEARNGRVQSLHIILGKYESLESKFLCFSDALLYAVHWTDFT